MPEALGSHSKAVNRVEILCYYYAVTHRQGTDGVSLDYSIDELITIITLCSA